MASEVQNAEFISDHIVSGPDQSFRSDYVQNTVPSPVSAPPGQTLLAPVWKSSDDDEIRGRVFEETLHAVAGRIGRHCLGWAYAYSLRVVLPAARRDLAKLPQRKCSRCPVAHPVEREITDYV